MPVAQDHGDLGVVLLAVSAPTGCTIGQAGIRSKFVVRAAALMALDRRTKPLVPSAEVPLNRIRLATSADVAAILAIYAPIVRETAISFEVEVPTAAEMQQRIEVTMRTLPWLVAEAGGEVRGYAYASKHRERAAYQWSVDVSVYVAPEARRIGIARALYEPLLGILEDLGYSSAFAGIALPNEASVRFHESMGFRPIGVYRKVGYKQGAWHDVGWWQRELRDYGLAPEPPLPMERYVDSPALRRRLSDVKTG